MEYPQGDQSGYNVRVKDRVIAAFSPYNRRQEREFVSERTQLRRISDENPSGQSHRRNAFGDPGYKQTIPDYRSSKIANENDSRNRDSSELKAAGQYTEPRSKEPNRGGAPRDDRRDMDSTEKGILDTTHLSHRHRKNSPAQDYEEPKRRRADDRPRGRTDDHPSWEQPRGRTDDHPSWEQPFGRTDKHPSWEQPRGRTDEHPSREQSRGRTDEHTSWEQPRGRTDERPSREQPRGRTDERPSREQPRGRTDERPSRKQPRGRTDERPSRDSDNKQRRQDKAYPVIPENEVPARETRAATGKHTKKRSPAPDSSSDCSCCPCYKVELKQLRRNWRRDKEGLSDGYEQGLTRAVSDRYGKYGIISVEDRWSRRDEFTAWLSEVKNEDLESLGMKDERLYYEEFVEDYNTATMPSRRYYDLSNEVKHVPIRRTDAVFDDEIRMREEVRRARELKKERQFDEAYKNLKLDHETLKAMKRQKELRLEMDYLFKTGKVEEARIIQQMLRAPDETKPDIHAEDEESDSWG